MSSDAAPAWSAVVPTTLTLGSQVLTAPDGTMLIYSMRSPTPSIATVTGPGTVSAFTGLPVDPSHPNPFAGLGQAEMLGNGDALLSWDTDIGFSGDNALEIVYRFANGTFGTPIAVSPSVSSFAGNPSGMITAAGGTITHYSINSAGDFTAGATQTVDTSPSASSDQVAVDPDGTADLLYLRENNDGTSDLVEDSGSLTGSFSQAGVTSLGSGDDYYYNDDGLYPHLSTYTGRSVYMLEHMVSTNSGSDDTASLVAFVREPGGTVSPHTVSSVSVAPTCAVGDDCFVIASFYEVKLAAASDGSVAVAAESDSNTDETHAGNATIHGVLSLAPAGSGFGRVTTVGPLDTTTIAAVGTNATHSVVVYYDSAAATCTAAIYPAGALSDPSTSTPYPCSSDGDDVSGGMDAAGDAVVYGEVPSGNYTTGGLLTYGSPGGAPATVTATTPVITGTVAVGRTVGCAESPKTGATITYSWKISTAIKARTKTYTVPASAVGDHLTCTASVRVGAGPTSSATSKAATVGKGKALRATKRPSLKGRAAAGHTLSVKPGTWTPAAKAYRYQWLRAGKRIKGATHASYKLGKKTSGKTVACDVTATRPGYANGHSSTKATAIHG